MITPVDGHLDICDVWTLYAVLYGMALYRRPRLLHLLSTTPNEAVRVICCECLGAAPHRFTPRRFGCYTASYVCVMRSMPFVPMNTSVMVSWAGS